MTTTTPPTATTRDAAFYYEQVIYAPDGVELRLVPHEQIVLNPDNYNLHPPEQLKALIADLKRFRQVKPYVVKRRGERRYMLVAGEGLWTAAGQMIEADPAANADLALFSKIAIAPEHWTEADALGYLVADNRTGLLSTPDDEKLAALVKQQLELGHSLDALGVDEEEYRQWLESLDTEAGLGGEDGDEDEYPEEGQAPARARLGDLWALGRHRLLCADACVAENYLRLLGEETTVHFVWSDPPYGINIVKADGHIGPGGGRNLSITLPDREAERRAAQTGKPVRRRRITKLPDNVYAPVIGDDSPLTAHASFRLCQQLFPKACQVWWGANHYGQMPGTACWIVWDKENDGTGFADAELAWCSDKGAVRIFRHMWNGLRRDSEQGVRRVHPNQKPVALFTWAAEKYGHAGDVILDPFLGSGISVIGAEKLGDDRTVYGMELSPGYIDVVIARWEKLTGQEATLLERAVEEAEEEGSSPTAARGSSAASRF